MPVDAATPAGELIPSLLRGVASPRASVRFASSKALARMAEQSPELLYPYFDSFLKQLDSDNSIFRWNAMRTLAALAPVDSAKRLDRALEKYLSPIAGPQMIGAAAAMQGAAAIALAKPYLAERVASAILGVRRAKYETGECRNVAMGHAIKALERILPLIEDRAGVLRFVRAQRRNSRPATRAKALAFLKRVG